MQQLAKVTATKLNSSLGCTELLITKQHLSCNSDILQVPENVSPVLLSWP